MFPSPMTTNCIGHCSSFGTCMHISIALKHEMTSPYNGMLDKDVLTYNWGYHDSENSSWDSEPLIEWCRKCQIQGRFVFADRFHTPSSMLLELLIRLHHDIESSLTLCMSNNKWAKLWLLKFNCARMREYKSSSDWIDIATMGSTGVGGI